MGTPFRGHTHLRPLWKAEGYSPQMASAIVTKPPGLSLRRLYHLTTPKHAASNLQLGRLKVARINDLNDPFEFFAVTNRLKTGAYARSLEEKAAAHEQYGIICLSADWRCSSLWGHYAEKHHGVCFGFNVPRSLPFEVRYRRRRIEEKGLPPPLPGVPADVQTKLNIKSIDWRYEKEWRIVAPLSRFMRENDLYFQPFGETLELAEIILGLRCPLSLEDVRECARQLYPKATVIRARLARQHFSVVADEDTIPRDLG